MSFGILFSYLADTVSISLATLIFLWFYTHGKREEGETNLKLELLIMIVTKTSPWVSIPVGLYKLFVGGKEIGNAKFLPMPNRSEIIQLMWWGLGLEIVGIVSTLLDILK